MADVRDGKDLRLGRPVAIKFLRTELAEHGLLRQRFEVEARAAARIADHHVVAIFDSGEHEGVPYIVMERLSGRTLGDEIADGPLAEPRARDVLTQVLRALEAAHAESVLHRDIKPSNILMATNGDAKVADFGIAKTAEDIDITTTGALLGTAPYLAPERLHGDAATVATDLYSAGVVLYEALTGAKPFQADTPLGVVHAIIHTDPRPLGELRPDITDDLVAVVERAMAKNPTNRYPDAAAMRAALGQANISVNDAAVTTVLHTLPRRDDLDPLTVLDVASAVERPSESRIDRRANVAILALVVGLLLLGIGIAATHDFSTTGTGPTTATTAPTATAASFPTPPALSSALDELDHAVAP